MLDEASEIMRLTPAEGLALQEKVKGGAPADVRRYTLYAAWRSIQADRFIPTRKKPAVFKTVCRTTDVEVVSG